MVSNIYIYISLKWRPVLHTYAIRLGDQSSVKQMKDGGRGNKIQPPPLEATLHASGLHIIL